MIHRNILLLEPGYRNKYPPLGLMKLSQYHQAQGKGKHNIVFAKGESDSKLEDFYWDRIYITTLFSFEWKKTAKCIDRALELTNGRGRKIFVGGISASLMTDEFKAIRRWKDIRFIQGLLDKPPAQSLQLNSRDFGWKDDHTTPIEEHLPDYSILEQIDYTYPVHNAYFGYASRGCIRKCSFCGVPKLEGEQRTMPPVSKLVNGISTLYGEKKDLILMDNNVTASPEFKNIIAEIRDLGFTPDAKLGAHKRRVDFNQGVDARLLSKTPGLLKEFATICIDPLRIAFDHVGLRKPYEISIRAAAEHGITSLSNYMLYNFHDTPEDLYQRLVLNIRLNDELGIRIWSFPMRYQPINLKDRSHVGKHWNRYYLRSFQVILQATHGVVTGNPDFFNTAFGASVEEFYSLLLMPHGFIFNRGHYFSGAGRPVLDEYQATLKRLSNSQRNELIAYLTAAQDIVLTRTSERLGKLDSFLVNSSVAPNIKNVLRFYISHYQPKAVKIDSFTNDDLIVPEEKKIEDAGLFDDDMPKAMVATG